MDTRPYIPINGEIRKKIETKCGDIIVGVNGPYLNWDYRYALEFQFLKFEGLFDTNNVEIVLNGNKQHNFDVWLEGEKMEEYKFSIKGKSNYVILDFGLNKSSDVRSEVDEIRFSSDASIITSENICGIDPISLTVYLNNKR